MTRNRVQTYAYKGGLRALVGGLAEREAEARRLAAKWSENPDRQVVELRSPHDIEAWYDADSRSTLLIIRDPVEFSGVINGYGQGPYPSNALVLVSDDDESRHGAGYSSAHIPVVLLGNAEYACPGHLTWSAFGADHPDTVCANSLKWQRGTYPGRVLCNADYFFSPFARIPCPFCDPERFLHYQFGGGYRRPVWEDTGDILPDWKPIHIHDGEALTFTAERNGGQERVRFIEDKPKAGEEYSPR